MKCPIHGETPLCQELWPECVGDPPHCSRCGREEEEELQTTVQQQEVVDVLFGHGFWETGRSSGKSWLRAYLIRELEKAEQHENPGESYV